MPAAGQITGVSPNVIDFYGCEDETTAVSVHGSGAFSLNITYSPGYTGTLNVNTSSSTPTTFTVSHSNPLGSGVAVLDLIQSGNKAGSVVLVDLCCYYNLCSGGAVAGDATLDQTSLALTLAAPSVLVTVANKRSVPITTTASVTSGAPWLSLSAPDGWTVAPNSTIQFRVSADAAGLLPSQYTGLIHFYLDPLNAFDVPVSFNFLGPFPLTLDSASLTFYGQPAGNLPPPQTLGVTASSPTTFTAAASSEGCVVGGWMAIDPSGTLTTNQQIVVSPIQLGYSEATCTGSIALTAGGQTATIPVSLVLAKSPAAYQLTSAPSSLQFTYLEGGSAPTAQSVQISSAAPSTAVGFTSGSSTAGTAHDWMHINIRSATSPATLAVTADPTGLTPGTYPGAITVLADTSSLTVPVTLTVASPTVTAAPQSLSLTYQAGATIPTGNIQVSGGGASLNFTAVASTGWLSVSPGSGTTPATGATSLTVSINPAGLLAGQTYTGSVTIVGTAGAAGTTTVDVTLQVLAPAPFISKITNAASGASGTVAPGEMISIFGNGIGPATPAGLTLNGNGTVSTTAGGVQVIFLPSGAAAPILYAGTAQVNAIVPYEISASASVQVQVNYSGQTSNAIPLSVTGAVPGIFTADGSGTGIAAVLNYDAAGNVSYNSDSNPAAPGSYIAFFVTGEGQTSPAGATGQVTTPQATAPVTPQPVFPLSVFLDNQPLTASFWGEEPDVVSGIMQVNIRIPAAAQPGPLPLAVSVGGATSQNGVTVIVQ